MLFRLAFYPSAGCKDTRLMTALANKQQGIYLKFNNIFQKLSFFGTNYLSLGINPINEQRAERK
jgi:hypothetical protein